MRWFRFAAVSSLCFVASLSGAAEPQAQILFNPYAAGPTAVIGQPVPAAATTTAMPISTWRGTTSSTSIVEPATPNVVAHPLARSLPTDRLLALRVAMQVRSPAEAYRATDLPTRHNRTADWNASPQALGMPRRDEAVKPAAWIEDVPPPVFQPKATTPAPQLLSDVTTAHQGATRLTQNPYRHGDAATNRSASPVVTISDNPLR